MEELHGTVVLVHPELMNDPARRQGQVGTVAAVDIGKDEIHVGFKKGPIAAYSTDALLVFKPHSEIYKDLLTRVRELAPQDFKAMLRISMLLESGSPKQVQDAMELAMTSYQTLSRSTISLQDQISRSYEESQGKLHSAIPGR